MNSTKLSEELRKLAADNQKRTKSSRLNDVFDDIEHALNNGISRQSIIDLLAENGFEISMKTFESSLARLRKKRKEHADIKSSSDIQTDIKTVNNNFSTNKLTENPAIIPNPNKTALGIKAASKLNEELAKQFTSNEAMPIFKSTKKENK